MMRILRLGLFMVFMVGLAWPASALPLSTTVCPGAGCVSRRLASEGSVGVQITGSFSGTLQFESSINGTTWVPWSVTPNGLTTLVTSTTTAGYWVGTTAGAQYVRVRFSAYSTGTANVTTAASIARAFSGGSGTYVGILPFAQGGLGFATATTGDLFYASATNTPNKLPDVAVGQVLVSGGVGVAPAYSSAPAVTSLSTTAEMNAGTAVHVGAATTYDRILIEPVAKGANQFDGTITSADLTAARQWKLPDAALDLSPTTQNYVLATGAAAAGAPALRALVALDIPSLDAAKIGSGIFGANRGGTNNAYFQISGPSSLHTYTVPDADASLVSVATNPWTRTATDLTTTTANDTVTLGPTSVFRIALATPAVPTPVADNGSGSLAAGIYQITVVAVGPAGGLTCPAAGCGVATYYPATTTGGASHIDVGYALPTGAALMRVWVSAVNGATPTQYFESTNATTYALTTLAGATAAALPATANAYRASIGGTLNWLGGAPMMMGTGLAIETDMVAGHTFSLAGYTGAAYSNLLTITNAATPTIAIPVLSGNMAVGTITGGTWSSPFTGVTRTATSSQITLTAASTPLQSVVPGADLIVVLPTAAASLGFVIHNSAAFTITVKDASANVVGTVTNGQTINVIYDGSTWLVW